MRKASLVWPVAAGVLVGVAVAVVVRMTAGSTPEVRPSDLAPPEGYVASDNAAFRTGQNLPGGGSEAGVVLASWKRKTARVDWIVVARPQTPVPVNQAFLQGMELGAKKSGAGAVQIDHAELREVGGQSVAELEIHQGKGAVAVRTKTGAIGGSRGLLTVFAVATVDETAPNADGYQAELLALARLLGRRVRPTTYEIGYATGQGLIVGGALGWILAAILATRRRAAAPNLAPAGPQPLPPPPERITPP